MPTPNLLNPWQSPIVDEQIRQTTGPVYQDIYQNPQNVLKGAATAPFTMAPDILGMLGAPISGDPIRELVGLDPNSPAGLLGEFMDPTSAAMKVGKGLLALPLIPAAVLRKRGFTSEPLFHGTNRAFDKFERGQRGTSTGSRSARRGVWLTDDPDLAGAYADLARSEELGRGWDKVMELERQGQYDAAAKLTRELEEADKVEAAGQQIRPARVRGKLMEVDMEGADYSASGTSDRIHDIISEAESKGFDGVRFKNLSDDPRPFTNKPSTHILMFDEKNIAGEFDFLDDVGDEALQRAELPKAADPGSVEETKLTRKQVEEFRQRMSDFHATMPVRERKFKGFTTHTDIPNFEDAMNKPDYFREKKNTVVEMVVMTPDDYLNKAAAGFGSPRSKVEGERVADLVDEYAEAMKRGDEFPAPYLDYKDGFNQEGIHRAMAAKKAGIKLMPVAIRKAAEK